MSIARWRYTYTANDTMKLNYNYKNEDGEYAPYVLPLQDGRKVINPTAAMYAEAGYYPYTPPQPTEEELAKQSRKAEISDLRDRFAENEWKIIKTCEYRLVGKPDPYDTEALHEERQALRDRINELEKELDIE